MINLEPSVDDRLVALFSAKLLYRTEEPAQVVQRWKDSGLFGCIEDDLMLIRAYYKAITATYTCSTIEALYFNADELVSAHYGWASLRSTNIDLSDVY